MFEVLIFGIDYVIHPIVVLFRNQLGKRDY